MLVSVTCPAPADSGSCCCARLCCVADVLERCAKAVLNLEQQPPDEALIKAAEAASATPNAEAYAQHQAHLAGAASARRERATAASSSGRDRRAERRERDSKADRADKKDVPQFPRSDDPAVQHKLRLLRSAPYTEMRAGDWFCGECGAHNYSFKHVCFRWGSAAVRRRCLCGNLLAEPAAHSSDFLQGQTPAQ